MKLSSISSFSNHISYTGHRKAIPLAAMIALSPVANAQEPMERIIMITDCAYATPNEKLSTNKDCFVKFISTDNNNNDAEKIELEFVKYGDDAYDTIYNIYADTLTKKNAAANPFYYVSGDVTVMKIPCNLPENRKLNNMKSYNTTGKVEISKELYEFLKEEMGDKIIYKTEQE